MRAKNSEVTRRDFLAATSILAGAGVAWHYGGTISLAQIGIEQIPHEGRLAMPMLGADTEPRLDLRRQIGTDIYNAQPRLVMDAAGILWAVAVMLRGGREELILRRFDGNAWGPETTLSTESHAAHPAVCAHGNGLLITWAERRGWQNWRLVAAVIGANGNLAGRRFIRPQGSGAGILWRPAVASTGGRAWIAWEEKGAGESAFRVRLTSFDVVDGPEAEPWELDAEADTGDRLRPHLAAGPDGTVWLTYDEADGPGGSSVYLLNNRDRAPLRVTHHAAFDHAPAVAVGGDGRVWVVWHSNRKGADEWDIPRWFLLRCYDPTEGRWYEPAEEPPGKELDKTGTDQSFEFPRVVVAPDGKVLVTGRPSHNFCLQMLQSDGWSPLYRLPADGWGGRGQFLSAVFDGEGGLYVIRRDLQRIVLNHIVDIPASSSEPPLREVSAPERQLPLVNIQKAPARWEPLEDLEEIEEPLHHYYGDIHGHTWTSDGMGDVDEYYRIRKEYYEDDFASLTDHDTFVGQHIFPSEFALMNELAAHYNDPGRFATLFGQEYTTGRPPNGLGHKCLYHTEPIPLLDHFDPAQDTGAKLAARLRELGGIMVPHHVGWTGTDWENHSSDVQPLVEICSNHGVMEYQGNTPIPHRGGMRGYFVQDALANGLKFGLIGGSDNHGLIWHHRMAFRRDSYRTGLAVVLAPELTREAIFDAMKKRRTYATTGIKPRLDFRVNNHLMGEEINAPGGQVVISAEVISPNRLKWLEVVKDNETWYQYGGEGYISRFTVRDNDPGPGTHWYYLRVIFDGPDMAWSSPIWVTV